MTLFLWIYCILILLGGAAAAGSSLRENEPRAAVCLSLLALGSALPYAVLASAAFPGKRVLASVALAMPWVLAAVFFRKTPDPALETGIPDTVDLPRVDERDVMFSRAVLVPGTDQYTEYYSRHPEKETLDNVWRSLPGLLAPDSMFYDPVWFASAEASFRAVAELHSLVTENTALETSGMNGTPEWIPMVSGSNASVSNGKPRPGTPGGMPVAATDRLTDRSMDRSMDRTAVLIRRAKAMGALDAGVTRLQPYHLYSHVGRGPDTGKPVELDHPFALALTVEMDRTVMQHAPYAPVVAESALQYFRCGAIAVQLALLIRELGFRARAHIDANYRVICPLVARDAGLGEIGRMGLLMTPRQGPRVRIAVVTTDMPLEPSVPEGASPGDPAMIDFCRLCRKCAEVCPSRAIPIDDRQRIDGALRWRIDPEKCFTYWCRAGTDCGRCMAVCPYAHPDGGLHSLVRWGIRRNGMFRRVAVWMDDFVYGR